MFYLQLFCTLVQEFSPIYSPTFSWHPAQFQPYLYPVNLSCCLPLHSHSDLSLQLYFQSLQDRGQPGLSKPHKALLYNNLCPNLSHPQDISVSQINLLSENLYIFVCSLNAYANEFQKYKYDSIMLDHYTVGFSTLDNYPVSTPDIYHKDIE